MKILFNICKGSYLQKINLTFFHRCDNLIRENKINQHKRHKLCYARKSDYGKYVIHIILSDS